MSCKSEHVVKRVRYISVSRADLIGLQIVAAAGEPRG